MARQRKRISEEGSIDREKKIHGERREIWEYITRKTKYRKTERERENYR